MCQKMADYRLLSLFRILGLLITAKFVLDRRFCKNAKKQLSIADRAVGLQTLKLI
jgi:uncharacterized membrane protein